MHSGASDEAPWLKGGPRQALSTGSIAQIIQPAFPHGRVVDIEPLTGGCRNSNFKLRIDCLEEPAVLRIFENDPALCQKELDLIRMLGDEVPVPEVIYANPAGLGDIPPYVLQRFVEGISLGELRQRGNPDATAEAAHSAGGILAAIHRVAFPKGGWLKAGPTVSTPLLPGANPMARYVDLCMSSALLQKRLTRETCERVHDLMWSALKSLAKCEAQTNLVHGDFSQRNILVREIDGKWAVAAVLDWEFAVAGATLGDFGNFLRYERKLQPAVEPFFSTGYLEAGGSLPEDWRQRRKLVDFLALGEMLTRETLPAVVVLEIAELIQATLENRDPQFPWDHNAAFSA